MSKKWTQKEINFLIKTQGKYIPKIKQRTKSAVRNKMISLGLISKVRRWTPEEIQLLFDNKNVPNRSKLSILKKKHELGIKNKYHRLSSAEIDSLINNKTLPNRHQTTIRRKLIEFGFVTKRETRTKWTKEEVEELINLNKKGHSAKTIFEMNVFNNKSQNSIQKKMSRLNLVKKIKIIKFNEETRLKFKKFLLENWEGKTPQDLIDIWNKSNHKTPASLRKVIMYLMNLKIKISCYEVQKINNLRKKEKKLNLENKDSANKLLDNIRAERIKLMRERFSESKDIWTGLECKQEIQI